jgi:hypothetical protein
MRFNFLFLSLVLIFSINNFAQQPDRLDELQKRFLEQQKVLQELETQVDQKEKVSHEYTEKIVSEYLQTSSVQDTPVITAGYEKGFFLKDSSGDFKFVFTGYMRDIFFLAETGTDNLDNSFHIIATRPVFNFYLFDEIYIKIAPEVGNATLRDAFLEYRPFDFFKVRVGQFKVFFSMQESLLPDQHHLGIIPSPYVSAVPARDMGIMIFGDGLPIFCGEFTEDYLSYSIGLFNGSGINSTDNNNNKMVVGDLTFYPLTRKEKFYIRVAGYTNDSPYRENGARINLFSLLGPNAFTVYGANNGGTFDDNDTKGRTTGAAASLLYERDNLTIHSEFVWTRFNRERGDEYNGTLATFTPLEMWGFYTTVGYFIPFDDPKEKFGIEPLFKISYTTIDDNGKRKDASGNVVGATRGQDIWEIVFGARVHFNKHFHTTFNWLIYDLKETRNYQPGGRGGDLIQAFLCQTVLYW